MLPVHRILLVERRHPHRGDDAAAPLLADAGSREFLLVLNPLPIVGATGARSARWRSCRRPARRDRRAQQLARRSRSPAGTSRCPPRSRADVPAPGARHPRPRPRRARPTRTPTPHRAVLRSVRRWGGTAEATVIGSGDRLPAPAAALVNGTLAHSLDFDDTHLPSVLHPSASVVPAALAAAEATGASGAALLAAVAAGVELTNRLGMAAYDPATAQLHLLRTRPARHLDLRHDRLGRRGRRCCYGLDAGRHRGTRWGSPRAWAPA